MGNFLSKNLRNMVVLVLFIPLPFISPWPISNSVPSRRQRAPCSTLYIYIYTRRRRKDQAARKEENTKGEKIIGDERTEEESKKGKTHLKRQSVVNRVWNSFSRRYKTLKRGQGMFTLVLSLGALKNATDCGEVKVLHAKASELQAKGYLIDALEHYQR